MDTSNDLIVTDLHSPGDSDEWHEGIDCQYFDISNGDLARKDQIKVVYRHLNISSSEVLDSVAVGFKVRPFNGHAVVAKPFAFFRRVQTFDNNRISKGSLFYSVGAANWKNFQSALLFVTNLGVQSPFPRAQGFGRWIDWWYSCLRQTWVMYVANIQFKHNSIFEGQTM